MLNFFFSNIKPTFVQEETINEGFVFITKAFVFINASFIYKNKACVYRLLPIKNNFAIGPKEVYIGRRRTYLLIDYEEKTSKRKIHLVKGDPSPSNPDE